MDRVYKGARGWAGGVGGWETKGNNLDSNNSAAHSVFDMNPQGRPKLALGAVWHPMQSY